MAEPDPDRGHVDGSAAGEVAFVVLGIGSPEVRALSGFAGPDRACWRWYGRDGTGRRPCRWTTPTPSAARSHRIPATRPGGTGALAAHSDLRQERGCGRR